MPQLAEKLVGRAAELGALDEALAELERRNSRLLEIAGEPGIGKTRLLGELAARAAARRCVVLSGSAAELEEDLPFWVFVDALDEHVDELERQARDALGPDVLLELARVFPALRAGGGDAPAPGERYRTHRAVRQLLEVLAAPRPLVLLLDDVHWADSGSVELLGALLRRPPDAGVLIALAVRPRQLGDRLAGPLERAYREGSLARIDLEPLSRAEAGELLGANVGEAEGAALYADSGGNPFYLQQLARAPHRDGNGNGAAGVSLAGVEVPRAVAAALTEELALLPPAARRLLEGAAVAGDPFEPELSAAAAGLEHTIAIDALDELLRSDLVRHTDVPRRFRFRHPLVRGAVYEAAPGGWRLGAHERCARLLGDRGVPAAERAHHVERAARHGDLAAVAVLREAGEGMLGSAPAAAAHRFEAALRLLGPTAPERMPLLRALAGAQAAAGRFAEAYAATVETLALLPPDAVAARVQLTATCAGLEHLLGRHDAAHARLVAALDVLEDDRGGDAAPLLIHLAIDAFYRLEYQAMGEWAERALVAARASGRRPLPLMAASGVALAHALGGTAGDADAAYAVAATLSADLTDQELAGSLEYGGGALVACAVQLGRLREAGDHAERLLAVARASGRGSVAPVLFWAGLTRCLLGRLADAAEIYDEAIEIARLAGNASSVGWTLFGRSLVATMAGDVELALSCGEESAEVLAPLDDALPTMWSALVLASARLSADDATGAIDALLGGAGGEELGRLPPSWRADGFEVLARCRLALGRVDEADRAAAAAMACADRPLQRARAERGMAAVTLARGDAAGAATRALAAAAGAEAVGAVVEGALARVLAARALARAGDPTAAAAELLRAAATFDACGARHRRDAAERELRRLGHRGVHRRSRAGDADATGVASLTERELQIARLVVDRKTNAQIAAELFLSPKTVETHIRNLFQKLGVSSRVEVARTVERADRRARDHAP